ncbi:recombinase family protein [Streptomyces sp. NPDC001373]|uniref:recombinase family protein n=1 Tax=Streptomyces sp. NPDC001373 TaxID=3364565 RepID=UPI003688D5D8
MSALTTPSGRRLIRCFAYARISSDREGAGLGVARQFEDITALAEQLSTPQAEFRIVERFQDNDLSAYSGKPRPDYLRMLQGMRDGGTDCILAWHTDRLHRRPLELEEYIDVCEPRSIDTRTVKAGHLDLSTATGRMIARQLGVQARYEVERMIERQRRAREQMAQHGKHFGGRRPFGWEINGITPIDDEITQIQHAAQAILAGASLRAVAAEWNERGVRTSTGGEWGPNEVKKMLIRPRNAGIREHRGQEVATAQWPAALDEPTWRSVVRHLTDPARRTNVGRTARVSLGTGIYTCGECGKPVISGTCGSGPVMHQMPAYRCLGHISRRRDLIDDMVQLAVLERLGRPDAADLLVEREEPVDVRGAQEDMKEARELLDDLSAELGRGEMDLRSWRVASEGAKKRIADAEALLSRAVSVNPVAELVLADDVEAAWNALDLSRKRVVLSYLMTVTIHRARRGRQPGGGYWDPDSVRIAWKK